MTRPELTDRQKAVIRQFVHNDEFLAIKDWFVSYTPERGAEGRAEDSDAKNLGKLLGTRYVFNELTTLAKKPPTPTPTVEKENKQKSGSRRDPDLET